MSASATAGACAPRSKDATPTGALRAFLEAAERSAYEPGARREMFGLIDSASQAVLTSRAREASALSAGQDFSAWEMIPRESLRVHVSAGQAVYRERIDGDRAVVAVSMPESEARHEVRMVREGELWRVVLQVPSSSR